jgi:hypothetical protein
MGNLMKNHQQLRINYIIQVKDKPEIGIIRASGSITSGIGNIPDMQQDERFSI